jgi:hypothetical protein
MAWSSLYILGDGFAWKDWRKQWNPQPEQQRFKPSTRRIKVYSGTGKRLVLSRYQCRVLVNKVMNLWVPYKARNFLTRWATVSFWTRALLNGVSHLFLQIRHWPMSLHKNELHFTIIFTAMSKRALGPTQPPIQWIPGALSLGVKRPEREVDHSLPSSGEVKECVELYLHSPVRLYGVVFRSIGTTLNFYYNTGTHQKCFCSIQSRDLIQPVPSVFRV